MKLILRRSGINEGLLRGDDSDRARAKPTKRIYGTYKVYDKKTGGYFNGPTIILLLLVTAKITLPVGFRFYRPNPAIPAWNKTDEPLKQQGVKKSARPPKPSPNQEYPSKDQLMLDLLEEFKRTHSQIQVKAILVEALYGLNRIRENSVMVNPIFSLSRFSLNIPIFYGFYQIVRSIDKFVKVKNLIVELNCPFLAFSNPLGYNYTHSNCCTCYLSTISDEE